jgi:lipopolysaccharide export LptBFGC system permease protein LptF
VRFPWTIWRHVFFEMWRLLLLTTAVLVTVVSFAVTVRYTAEGKLGPLETLRFMSLAMVPMLQYVLPFAAGFGATLAYHRQSADNELTAAKASGVSHRSLIVPALVTGLILAGVLGVLNGHVIPRFLRSMEAMLAQDAAGMIAKTIEAGQPLELGRRLVYADRVYHLTPDHQEKGGPYEVLLLTGVAAVEVGPEGEVLSEVTASQATLAFFAVEENESGGRAPGGLTTVTLDLKNAQGDLKKLGQGQMGSQVMYFPIQGVFNDDPKYYTNREMAELPGDPDRINIVDARRKELAYRMAERETMTTLRASLRSQGQIRLSDPEGRTFVVHASDVTRGKYRWELSAADGKPVEVEMYRAGAGGQPDVSGGMRLSATSAGMQSDTVKQPGTDRLVLSLDLEDVKASAGVLPAGERTKLSYGGLSYRDNPLKDLLDLKSAGLLEEAARRTAGKPDEFIDAPARELKYRIERLRREVVAKKHERAAMSVACLVMVLAGALTAMRLASSLPLTVYLWSFFPALACVITVSAGQNVTRQLGEVGLPLLWGGVVALGLYTLGAFWLVRKN